MIELIGRQVTATLIDGSTVVGRLDQAGRNMIRISGVWLRLTSVTDVRSESGELANEDHDYCELCGHFHDEWDACSIVGSPCGDYRCCVN
jgi:hypothetical protein